MKTKGMLCMLTAVAAITIAITGSASAQQGSSQHKYTDDAIVRDLKAGKLTVREAQILQERNDRAAAKAAPKAAASTNAPKSSAKKAHAAKPVKTGKAAKGAKKKSKAPVKHLTSPHAAKNKANAKPPHAAAKGEAAKPVKPPKKKDKSEKDKAATKKPEPVRKTAVKYIR